MNKNQFNDLAYVVCLALAMILYVHILMYMIQILSMIIISPYVWLLVHKYLWWYVTEMYTFKMLRISPSSQTNTHRNWIGTSHYFFIFWLIESNWQTQHRFAVWCEYQHQQTYWIIYTRKKILRIDYKSSLRSKCYSLQLLWWESIFEYPYWSKKGICINQRNHKILMQRTPFRVFLFSPENKRHCIFNGTLQHDIPI